MITKDRVAEISGILRDHEKTWVRVGSDRASLARLRLRRAGWTRRPQRLRGRRAPRPGRSAPPSRRCRPRHRPRTQPGRPRTPPCPDRRGRPRALTRPTGRDLAVISTSRATPRATTPPPTGKACVARTSPCTTALMTTAGAWVVDSSDASDARRAAASGLGRPSSSAGIRPAAASTCSLASTCSGRTPPRLLKQADLRGHPQRALDHGPLGLGQVTARAHRASDDVQRQVSSLERTRRACSAQRRLRADLLGAATQHAMTAQSVDGDARLGHRVGDRGQGRDRGEHVIGRHGRRD